MKNFLLFILSIFLFSHLSFAVNNSASTQNVGIGSFGPIQALDVAGTVRTTYFMVTNNVSSNLGIGINPLNQLDVSGGLAIAGYGGVKVATTNAFVTNGNIGVGTWLPRTAVEVTGSSHALIRQINTAAQASSAGSGALVSVAQDDGTAMTVGDYLGCYNLQGSGNTTHGLISGAGICATANGTFSASSAPSILLLQTSSSGSATPSTRMVVDNFGNVGIGSVSPGTALDIQGTVRISQNIIVSGIASDAGKTDATICEDTTVHQFYSGSGTVGICLGTSTMQAKQNIFPINEGLPQIMSLKPISFNYRPGWGYDPKKPYYGFLAEDVAPVLPRLVGYNAKGETRNADYVGMIPVIVKSIQQLQNEIDELKKRSN